MATALLLRCDVAILSGVLLLGSARSGPSETFVDFKTNRADCERLFSDAEKTGYVLQQAESLLFWVRLAALELSSGCATAEHDE